MLAAGAAMGAAVGIGLFAGIHVASVPWVIAVGLTKLTLLASGGLMAAGAVCLRLGRRREARMLPRDVASLSRDETESAGYP